MICFKRRVGSTLDTGTLGGLFGVLKLTSSSDHVTAILSLSSLCNAVCGCRASMCTILVRLRPPYVLPYPSRSIDNVILRVCYMMLVSCAQKLQVMQEEQKLMVEFQDYPNVLIRMLNNCIKEPHSHLVVFVMQHDVNARLDFIQVGSASELCVTKNRGPTRKTTVTLRHSSIRSGNPGTLR